MRTHFNSRPSARGDLHKKTLRMDGDISIHAPPRGATADVPQLPSKRLISIHAPPRGATGQRCFLKLESLFQFTPLREGRRQLQIVTQKVRISIHAPPRGATSYTAAGNGRSLFQFTPLREGRPLMSSDAMFCATNFNSRPSARGDVVPSCFLLIVIQFQFTPLREGRLSPFASSTSPQGFQFTPLREGRQEPGDGRGDRI